MTEDLAAALERAQRRLREAAQQDRAATAVASFLAERREPTRSAYRHDLDVFATCVRGRGIDLLHARPEDVAVHLAELRNAGVRAATVRRRLAAIAGLYRHARRLGLTTVDPLAGVPRPREAARAPGTPSHASQNGELAALVAGASALGVRDRVLVLLLAQAGLRLCELLALDVEDVADDGGEGIVLRVRSPRRDDRELVLPDASTQGCRELIGGRRDGPLLITAGDRRLDRRHALRIVSRCGRLTGLRGPLTPRGIRQMFIGHALSSGLDSGALAAAVGLSDPRTLRWYGPTVGAETARDVPLRLASSRRA